jgi:hypothetical protein
MIRGFKVLLATGFLTATLALSFSAWGAAAPGASSKPATTQAAAVLACCGDVCKKMGAGCCKADDMGKVTCSMGGGCCLKPSTAPATAPAALMPAGGGMGGMNMGK